MWVRVRFEFERKFEIVAIFGHIWHDWCTLLQLKEGVPILSTIENPMGSN